MEAARLRPSVTALWLATKGKKGAIDPSGGHGYDAVLIDVVRLIDATRSAAARSVNAVMTATYWAIGRSIVEEQQKGAARAGYGEELVASRRTQLSRRALPSRNVRACRPASSSIQPELN